MSAYVPPRVPDDFDPDGPGGGGTLYGLPFAPDEALVPVLPVPWEATASYGRGTRGAPAAILAASAQVDLHDPDFGDAWRAGIAMAPDDGRIAALGEAVEADALAVIEAEGDPELAEAAARVDEAAEAVHAIVGAFAEAAFREGRIPAVLGGEHGAPFGLIRAAAEARPGLGVLHVDAHADLRPGYLGFRWSHASIMHHVLGLPGVGRLVGVGYRDLGRVELRRIAAEGERVVAFHDRDLARALAAGEPWIAQVDRIVEALPPRVHVSLDIDGLDPSLCPGTGTPVPGGLGFRDLQVLLARLAERREVVSFDLCEVGAGRWDADVGARVLHKLCGCAIRSRERFR